MTREEEIKYASKDYVNYLLDKQEYHNENYTEYDIQQAFEKGAQWADNNPKSPWISVDEDLPCNHEELMIVDDKGRPETKRVLVRIQETDTSFQRPYYADCMMSKWDVEEDKFLWHLCSQGYITHWMPIPKLPKE